MRVGRQQRLAQRAAQLGNMCAQASLNPCRRRVAHQGEAVGVNARRTPRRSSASPGVEARTVDDLFALDQADGKAGQVVFPLGVEAGHFGGFAADQRAARLTAALRHARDDVRPLSSGMQLAARPGSRGKTGASRRAQAMSLTHMATQSMPTVSCLSMHKGQLELGADAVGAQETSAGFSMPERSGANMPPNPAIRN